MRALGVSSSTPGQCRYPDTGSSNHNHYFFYFRVYPDELPFYFQPTSSSISTQTEPPIQIASESIPSPIPILELPIPNVTASPFNWADNTFSLSTLPLIISKQPRNLSSLRSSLKNPFSSLRRRHHYSKHQKNLFSCRNTQFLSTCPPSHHSPPPTNLDWHRDPCLFELSRVLRILGWSHP